MRLVECGQVVAVLPGCTTAAPNFRLSVILALSKEVDASVAGVLTFVVILAHTQSG